MGMPGPSCRTIRGSLPLGLAALLIPATAEAHTGLAGIGSFWAGVAQLLTSLDQLAFLIGLAIRTRFYDRRRLDVEWGRIARRAGASWIAAIGLMVLALSFVPPTRHG